MSNNVTKAVACRLPLDNYLELVKEASERSMTMSDLLLLKIYASSSTLTPSQSIQGADKMRTEREYEQMEEAFNEAWHREKKQHQEILKLRNRIEELESALKVYELNERLQSLDTKKTRAKKTSNKT